MGTHSYQRMVATMDAAKIRQPVVIRNDLRTIGSFETAIVGIHREEDAPVNVHVRIRKYDDDNKTIGSFQLDQMSISSAQDWDIFNKLVRSQFSVKAAPYVFARYIGPRARDAVEILKIDPIYNPKGLGSWVSEAKCQLFGYKSDYNWVSFEWRNYHPLILCRCVDQWRDGNIMLKPVCNVSKLMAKLLMYMEWQLACKPVGDRRVGLLHGNYPFMFYSKKGKDDLMAAIDHKKLESVNYIETFQGIRRSSNAAFYYIKSLKKNVLIIQEGE